MTAIACTCETLSRTLAILQAAGARQEERVVLWLSAAASQPLAVVEVYEPQQITAIDYFRLPPESVRALTAHLRGRRLKIVAQIHTHPGDAFHSKADDRWSIVRHAGALSLVLPRFARETVPQNFIAQAATYVLSAENKWVHVPVTETERMIEVLP